MFLIFNCNNSVVGNPKGYRTMRGALQQAESKKSKVFRAIWAAFYASEHANKESGNNLIYKVRPADMD